MRYLGRRRRRKEEEEEEEEERGGSWEEEGGGRGKRREMRRKRRRRREEGGRREKEEEGGGGGRRRRRRREEEVGWTMEGEGRRENEEGHFPKKLPSNVNMKPKVYLIEQYETLLFQIRNYFKYLKYLHFCSMDSF